MRNKKNGKTQLRDAYVIIRRINELIGATDKKFLRYYDIIGERTYNEEVDYNALFASYREEVGVALIGIQSFLHDNESLTRERNNLNNILNEIKSTYPAIFEDRNF